ncbi:MAG: GntR family transcriptional regulator [Sphaerochaetaceae bacterium]|nr:GntR family transcriptional regulator [Sphaerochaetaceae bacterium]
MQGQTQKITAYSYLKEKLLNCEFKPGQYLNEKEIVQSSCFGRTPVREALILLQAEKLVEVVPRKGTYARSINRSEVVDMYELRKLIEPAIIEKYLTNIDLQKLEILDQKLKETLESEPQDDRKFNELDIAFHRFLASASRCQRIIATLEPALQESYRVSMYNNLNGTSNSLERTYQQHHDVVSAIIAENRGRAKEALLVHLNASLFSSLASLNT